MRFLVVLVSLTAVARADDGLRCGEWLVEKDAAEAEVAAKCGAPTHAERRPLRWHVRWGSYRMLLDLWTYDLGANDFIRTLEFHDGVLVSVTIGDRGN